MCSKPVRPEDLIVDQFFKRGMDEARRTLCVEEGEPLIRKLKLVNGDWEVLPEEDAEGEQSESESEEPETKTRRVAEEEIILD